MAQVLTLEFWIGGWKRLWYLRGVLAALTLLGVLKSATGIGAETFLALFHTLFRDWNLMMGWLGALVPFVPDVPSEVMNGLTFMLVTAAPTMVEGVVEDFRSGAAEGAAGGVTAAVNIAGSLLLIAAGAFFIGQVLGGTMMDGMIIPADQRNVVGDIGLVVMLGSWVLVPLLFFWVFCRERPTYFRGIWSVVLFLATLEALFWLKAPYLSGWMQDYICARGHVTQAQCPPAS